MLALRHGNPAGAVDAFRFCGEHRQPLPDALWRWILPVLEDYVRTLPAPAAGKGRYARWSNAHEQHRQNVWSWRALRSARARGLKGYEATDAAEKDLVARGVHVTPRAIENGFREIQRWLKHERPSRLLVIQRLYPDEETEA